MQIHVFRVNDAMLIKNFAAARRAGLHGTGAHLQKLQEEAV